MNRIAVDDKINPTRVIDLTAPSARVIAIEESETPATGIPVYVRKCTNCSNLELDGDWYFAPDRDLGIGWSCPRCSAEDQYTWAETSLSNVSKSATARIAY